VSESGIEAGKNAAKYVKKERNAIGVAAGKEFLYLVPQSLDLNQDINASIEYFRVSKDVDGATLKVTADGKELIKKKYPHLRGTEMEKIVLDYSGLNLNKDSKIEFKLEGGELR
jgi:hypothetical protein